MSESVIQMRGKYPSKMTVILNVIQLAETKQKSVDQVHYLV